MMLQTSLARMSAKRSNPMIS